MSALPDLGGLVWVDWRDRILSLGYPGGIAYDYYGVPEFVYSELMSARSKNSFVNAVVKRRFLCRVRST